MPIGQAQAVPIYRPGAQGRTIMAVPIGQAQAVLPVPIYRPGAQGRSIMGNNVKIWLLLPILTGYCLFSPIIDLPENGSPARGKNNETHHETTFL